MPVVGVVGLDGSSAGGPGAGAVEVVVVGPVGELLDGAGLVDVDGPVVVDGSAVAAGASPAGAGVGAAAGAGAATGALNACAGICSPVSRNTTRASDTR